MKLSTTTAIALALALQDTAIVAQHKSPLPPKQLTQFDLDFLAEAKAKRERKAWRRANEI